MEPNQVQSAGVAEDTVDLAGRKFTIATPPIVDIYAGMVARWQELQPDVIGKASAACEVAPPSQHEAIWAAALKSSGRKPTKADLDTFVNSLEGIAYVLWVCLKKHHGDEFKTPNSVMPLVAEVTDAKLNELMHKTKIVTGEAEAKNSSGQIPSE